MHAIPIIAKLVNSVLDQRSCPSLLALSMLQISGLCKVEKGACNILPDRPRKCNLEIPKRHPPEDYMYFLDG